MNKKQTKLFKKTATLFLAIALVFTTVNAQAPKENLIDSSLFKEIVKIPDRAVPDYYRAIEKEVLDKKDKELNEINEAAKQKADAEAAEAKKAADAKKAGEDIKETPAEAKTEEKAQPEKPKEVEVKTRARIAKRIYEATDLGGTKVYRVYGTYDGKNEGFYEVNKDLETLKSVERVDLDLERPLYVAEEVADEIKESEKPKPTKPENSKEPGKEEEAQATNQINNGANLNATDATFEQLTPTNVPEYYTGPTSQDRMVYKFVGRDRLNYYRIYGTVDGNNEGFYASNQYGLEPELSAPIDLTNENLTLAPYKFESMAPSEVPTLDGFTKDNTVSSQVGYDVYRYDTNINGIAFRSYGKINNVNDADQTIGWHYMTKEGQYDSTKGHPIAATIQSIEKEHLNLSKNGFIESKTAPTKPSYYGGPKDMSTDKTITERKMFYSFTGKDGKGYYRVHGTFEGVEGFYDTDKDGNVNYPAKMIDLKWEEENLKPIDKRPGGDLADAPDNAYIKEALVTDVVDGVGPFDNDSNPGNDENNKNGIVRSFDKIIYNVNLNLWVRESSEFTSFNTARVYVEYTLPVDSKTASFDTTSMKEITDIKVVEQDGKQILTGYRKLSIKDGEPPITGTQDMAIHINVHAAKNGTTIQPSFKMWLDGNPADGSDIQTIKPNTVTVSAAPKYNTRIQRNTYASDKGYFNFKTGKFSSTKTSDEVLGRMQGYGVVVQLYNTNASKGLKGIEVPQGPITVNLDLNYVQNKGGSDIDVTESMTPMLWDYKIPVGGVYGRLGRDMRPMGNTLASNGYGVTPLANPVPPYGLSSFRNDVGNVDMTQAGSKLQLTFKDYNFDFADKSWIFPTTDMGNMELHEDMGKNVGTFTGAYFQVIYPLPENVSQTMTFNGKITTSSYNATSVTGVKTNVEQKVSDDVNSAGILLTVPGTRTKLNWLTRVNGKNSGSHRLNTGIYQGDAWAYEGQDIKMWSDIWFEKGDVEYSYAAFNYLQKFDDKAFEPKPAKDGYPDAISEQGSLEMNTYKNIRVRYGAKPDKTGWKNDAELLSTKENQLVYFETLSELKSNGYVPVALLYEQREGLGGPGVRTQMATNFQVKKGSASDNVYQTVGSIRYWIIKDDIDDKLTMVGNNPSSPTVFPKETGVIKYADYVKTRYDEHGNVTRNHTPGYIEGQSLKVVSRYGNIYKSVEQLNAGKEKETFLLDNGERIVDYRLDGRYYFAGNSTGGGTGETTGKVVITDQLFPGLSYIPGSATVGGNYIRNKKDGLPGTVDGGVLKEPIITTEIYKPLNDKGEADTTNPLYGKTIQVLTWEFENVPVGKVMDPIRFKAEIGTVDNPETDVKDNESLVNLGNIYAEDDGRAHTIGNTRIARNEIIVKKSASTSFTKAITKPIVDINDQIEFSLTYANSGMSSLSNVRLLDVLPYNNDSRGTKFDGTYLVDEIKIHYSKAPKLDNFKVYYTTDAKYKDDKLVVGTLDYSGWTEMTRTGSSLDFTYKINNGDVPVSFIVVGNLDSMTGIKLDYKLKPSGNHPGNIYANNASVINGAQTEAVVTPSIEGKVAKRMISGVAWFDSNRNGQRDPSEALLANVGVQLVDSTGKVVTENLLGESLVGKVTNSRGVYEFDNLPQGDYKVRFVSNRNFDLKKYEVTLKQAEGVPSGVNSDAEGVYDANMILQEAFIEGIKLPKLEDMKDLNYVSGNNDIGLFYPYSIEKHSTPEGKPSDVEGKKPLLEEGDVVTYTLTVNSPRGKLNNVIVGDTIPEGMSFVPGSIRYKLGNAGAWIEPGDRAYNTQNRTVGWELNEVPLGKSLFEFKVVVDKLPEGENELEFGNYGVLKAGDDPTTSKRVEHSTQNRMANISKTAALIDEGVALDEDRGTQESPVDTKLSQIVEYRLTVKNTGHEDMKSNVINVEDTLPAGVKFVPGSMTYTFRDSATQKPVDGSSATASMVEPTDATKLLKWDLDKMSSGEEAYLTFRVEAPSTTLTGEDPETYIKKFENTATMKDTEKETKTYKEDYIDKDGKLHKVKDEAIYTEKEVTKQSETTYHQVAEPHITIKKSSDPVSGSVVKGQDIITYTIKVKNDGAATAKNVKITDPIPTGVRLVGADGAMTSDHTNTAMSVKDGEMVWDVTNLEAGQTVTVTYQVSVDALETIGEKTIENIAYASLNELPKIPSETITHSQSLNYNVEKTSDPVSGSRVSGKDVIKYTITVNNTSSEPLRNLVITDAIPEFTSYKANSIGNSKDAVMDDSGDTLKWTLPVLNGKDRAQFTFDVIVDDMEAEGNRRIENIGYYQFEGLKTPQPTNKIEHFQGITYTLEKMSDPASGSYVDGPQVVKYTLRVKNTGDSAITNLKVWDSIPEHTEYKAMNGYPNHGGSYEANEGDFNLGKVSWVVEDLAAKDSVELEFYVTVDRLTAGTETEREVPNTAYSQLPKEEKPKEATVFHKQKFGYEINKTSDVAANSYVDGNDIIEYTLTLTNKEFESLDNVVIKDAIPSYTEYVEGSQSSNRDDIEMSKTGDVLSWSIPELEKDGVMELKFKVKVKPLTQMGSRSIVNEAEYIIDGMPDYEKTNKITHYQEASFKLEKSSDIEANSYVDGKQIITYTLTLTNDGKQTLNDLAVRDAIPEFTKYVAGSIGHSGDGTVISKDDGDVLTWMVNDFKVGDEMKLTFKVEVDPLKTRGEREISNQAEGQLPDDPIVTKTNIIKHKQLMDYSVVKTSNPANSIVSGGDEIEYFITLENNGYETLRDVKITDDIPEFTKYVENSQGFDGGQVVAMSKDGDTLKWIIEGVGKTESAVAKFKVSVDPMNKPGKREILNAAQYEVVPDVPEETPPTKHEQIVSYTVVKGSTPTQGTPENPTYVNGGDVITYTLTVTNTGESNLDNLTVKDTLPEFTTYVENSMKYSGADEASVVMDKQGDVLKWDISGMAFESVMTLEFKVKVNPLSVDGDTTIRNVATKGLPEEPETPTNEIIHKQKLEYNVVKSADVAEGLVDEHQEITYTLTIQNTGKEDLKNFMLLDKIPNFTQYVDGSIASSSDTKQMEVIDGVATWVVKEIKAESTETVSFKVKVDPLNKVGRRYLQNVGQYKLETDPTYKNTNVINHEQQSEFMIEKSSDVADDSTVIGGQEITYILKFTNVGFETIQNGMIRDELPEEVEAVAGGISIVKPDHTTVQDITDTDGLKWSIANLKTDETVELHIKVRVKPLLEVGTRDIENTAYGKLERDPEERQTNVIIHHQDLAYDVVKESTPVHDSFVSAGEEIEYRIVINNTGHEPIKTLKVTDAIPEHTKYVAGSIANSGEASVEMNDDAKTLSWKVSDLAGETSTTMSFKVSVDDLTKIDSRDIKNIANYAMNEEPVKETNEIVHHQQTDYEIHKTSDPVDGVVDGGTKIRYILTLENTGKDTLNNLKVTDAVPEHTSYVAGSMKYSGGSGSATMTEGETLTWNVSGLKTGESMTLEFEVLVDALDVKGSEREILNTAYATLPDDETPKESETTRHTQKVDYEVIKRSTPKSGSYVDVNETITYEIEVTNTGNQTLRNLKIEDAIPEFTTYVANSMKVVSDHEAEMTDGETLVWNVLAVGVDESVIVRFEVKAQALDKQESRSIKNIGYVSLPKDPTPTPTNEIEHLQNLSYEFHKGSTPAPGTYVTGGDEITYTLTLENTGETSIHNFIAKDKIPEYTKLVENSQAFEGSSASVEMSQEGDVLVWSVNGVKKGETLVLKFTVTVDNLEGANERTIRNVATSKIPGIPEVPTEEVIHKQDRSYTFHKSSDPVTGSYVTAGDVITYSLTVVNTGEETLNKLKVRDDIPEGTTYVENSANSEGSSGTAVVTRDGNTLRWDVDGVKKGETIKLNFKVKVNELDKTNERSIRNVAYAHTPEEPERPTEEIEHKQKRSYTFKKSSDPASGSYVTAGDVITYKLTVENTGEETLNKLTVKDAVPSGTHLIANSQGYEGSSATVTMKEENNTLYWTLNGVKKGETITLSFKVSVDELDGTNENSIRNVATSEIPGIPEVPTEEVIHKQERSYTFKKSSDPVSGSYVSAGDTITYNLTLENTGEETLNKLAVKDAIPEHTTYVENSQTFSGGSGSATMTQENGVLKWAVDGLKKGETMTLSFKVTVDELGKENERSIRNVATSQIPGIPEVPTEEVIHKQDRSYTFHKSSDPKNGSVVNAGDTITYYLTLVNTGEETLNKLSVKDNIPEGTSFVEGSQAFDDQSSASATMTQDGKTLKWEVNGLKRGETMVLSFKVSVNELDKEGKNSIRNVATSELPGLPEVPTEEITHHQDLKYEIEKVSNPVSGSMVSGKSKIVYTIKVKNTGDQDLSNVMVKDAIPTHTKYVEESQTSSHKAEMKATPEALTWTLEKVKVGETATASFEVEVDPMVEQGTRDIKNIGYVKLAKEKDFKPTNETIHHQNASYEAHKSSEPGAGAVVKNGETIKYAITVKNTGDDALVGLTVKDSVPTHTELIQDSITSSKPEGVKIENKNGKITWTVESLEVGEEVVVNFSVRVAAKKAGAEIKNVAFTKLPGEPEVPTEEIVHPTTTSYVISKDSNPVSGTEVKPKETIKYMINVENTGGTVINNFVVKDSIPALTEYISGSAKSTVANTQISEGKEITWVIPEIQAGEKVQVSFEVKIEDIKEAGKYEIVNVAYGKSEDDPEFKPTNEVKHPVKIAKKNLPGTGMDNNNMGLYISVGGLLLVLTALIKKRKEKN